MEKLYTTHDISRLLQMDSSTISKWVDKHFITAFRTPGRHRRVRASDLRAFLVGNQMPIPEELGSGAVRLVVVDDEKPVLDAIKRAFKPLASQVEVTTTTSGVEALLLVSEQRPHGLLIDLDMPGMDGLEIVQRLRARTQLEGVRSVTMTARHTAEAEQQSLKAGAVACLAKPIDVQQVLELFRVPLALAARKV
ncbi:MAG: response regulator [Myxococcaceae bacterium]